MVPLLFLASLMTLMLIASLIAIAAVTPISMSIATLIVALLMLFATLLRMALPIRLLLGPGCRRSHLACWFRLGTAKENREQAFHNAATRGGRSPRTWSRFSHHGGRCHLTMDVLHRRLFGNCARRHRRGFLLLFFHRFGNQLVAAFNVRSLTGFLFANALDLEVRGLE
ncbi:MAG: hypothetical protein U1F34_03680, partial [Gammaproteobacteria bacterium]